MGVNAENRSIEAGGPVIVVAANFKAQDIIEQISQTNKNGQ